MSFLKFLVVGFWILGSPLRAEIVHADTMAQVEEQVNTLLKTVPAKEILVAFDVDDTLIRSSSARTPKLTEKITPRIIKDLQQKGVATIAFTAASTGKNSSGVYREFDRYMKLKSLDITFDQTINIDFDIHELGATYTYYRGILFANAKGGTPTKGTVLVAFLKRVNQRISPSVFIMVDDRRDQLKHIEQTLNETYPYIQFMGIEYEQPESALRKFKRKCRKALKWFITFLSSGA